MKLNSKK